MVRDIQDRAFPVTLAMLHRLFLMTCLSAAPIACQATWNVPTGGNLDSVIAQAAPGDILRLSATGFYGPVTLNKGVTILGNGAQIADVTCQIPQGQQASLGDVVMPYTGPFSVNTITVVSGRVNLWNISNLGEAMVAIGGGEVVIQRFSGRLSLSAGRCWVTDSVLSGTSACISCSLGSHQSSAAVLQIGGAINLSHCTLWGGWGDSYLFAFYHASPGFAQSAGVAWMTDCTVQGGSGFSGAQPGEAAISASGTMSIARTNLTEGNFGPVSGGFQQTPEMVGMTCTGQPSRGASFTATASAGDSQDVMGIVGGFLRTSNFVPPIVEPLFGNQAQLVTLSVGMPPMGGSLSATVTVPNVVGLLGVEVWLQAVQVAGVTMRASTVVGGTIR